MKQLDMISPIVAQRSKPVTKKNQRLMKQCFKDVYKMGMVSSETMQKVLATDYVRG